jgi:hypothetical protein
MSNKVRGGIVIKGRIPCGESGGGTEDYPSEIYPSYCGPMTTFCEKLRVCCSAYRQALNYAGFNPELVAKDLQPINGPGGCAETCRQEREKNICIRPDGTKTYCKAY